MAAKKKKKSKKTGKKIAKRTVKAPAAKKKRGASRACGVCGEIGHNKRSHDPGGKLAK